ncbi:hypothetical protein L1887_38691 [Cichorium endivia]|nr:hypothetical protein L1887_38691 [Cichorium endivia]
MKVLSCHYRKVSGRLIFPSPASPTQPLLLGEHPTITIALLCALRTSDDPSQPPAAHIASSVSSLPKQASKPSKSSNREASKKNKQITREPLRGYQPSLPEFGSTIIEQNVPESRMDVHEEIDYKWLFQPRI